MHIIDFRKASPSMHWTRTALIQFVNRKFIIASMEISIEPEEGSSRSCSRCYGKSLVVCESIVDKPWHLLKISRLHMSGNWRSRTVSRFCDSSLCPVQAFEIFPHVIQHRFITVCARHVLLWKVELERLSTPHPKHHEWWSRDRTSEEPSFDVSKYWDPQEMGHRFFSLKLISFIEYRRDSTNFLLLAVV